MMSIVPIHALPLPKLHYRFQQMLVKNRTNLEKSGIWNFLLWIREVKRVVREDKVKSFVHTYQMRTTKAKVGETTVDFSTSTIADVLKLPASGLTLSTLPDLTSSEAEEVFECKAQSKDNKWIIEGAKSHWKSWFEMINVYLLFRQDEHKMDQKAIVAAIRTWRGYRVNWALICQQKLH